ncbi:sensor histidine kinase [Xanthobacter flavus]|uniref:sensor histidine kinase n=1 Tax=Xanthobacter flavus TaxID=281 RepID=UPI0037293122
MDLERAQAAKSRETGSRESAPREDQSDRTRNVGPSSRDRAALFASAGAQPRTLFDSVRRRLILMVLLALAPIAALNIVQGVMQLSAAEEDARQNLLRHGLAAAASQQNVIASAENVLYALQNVDEVRSAGPTCRATLRGATISLPFVANIGVIDAAGQVTCTALPTGDTDMSDDAWWLQAIRQPGFSLSGRVRSTATDRDVVVGLLPLRDAAGRLEGGLALGIEIGWLDNLLRQQVPPSEGVVAVFTASGEELVSNARALSGALFQAAPFAAPDNALRESTDPSGRRWTYATTPLGREGLVVAYASPSDRLFGWTLVTVAASFALPALVMVASLIALWVAVDRIVLRWLLYLRRVTAVYAQGHYGFRPTRLDAAPSEFRMLGQSVENMAYAVRQRDARLRENLAEKTALVREIHHRIKNSLQVVVSLLSLYGGGMGKGEDRRRFDQLRTRVNTLALVHRILYEASDGSQVRLRELLGELASLIEGSSDKNLRLVVEAEEARLPTDMAVPLALMVVELVLGLTLRPGSTSLGMLISGTVDDDRLRLVLTGTADAPEEPSGLAGGFATQLGGTLTRKNSGDTLVIVGDFPCPSVASPDTAGGPGPNGT